MIKNVFLCSLGLLIGALITGFWMGQVDEDQRPNQDNLNGWTFLFVLLEFVCSSGLLYIGKFLP